MAAPHAPNYPKNSKKSIGSIFDFLLALFSQSQPWLRNVIVLGVFAAAAFGIYKWISQSKNSQPPSLQYSLDKGKQVAPPGNANSDPANVAATQRISEDEKHFKWHAVHEQHEPDWNVISQSDDEDFVKYKYYKETDRCVLLWRKENGQGDPQWIRDPIFYNKSAEADKSTPKNPSHLSDILVATASANPREFPDAHLQPIQAGCANPHPGAFNWWWGPPVDQCWSPMYRRFADGCTHHQMFNRCYNTWDPRIWWDYCTGAGQHY